MIRIAVMLLLFPVFPTARAAIEVNLDFKAPKTSSILEQSVFTRVLTYRNRILVKDEQMNGADAHSRGLTYDDDGYCRVLIVYSLPDSAKKGDEIIEQRVTSSGKMGFGYSLSSFQTMKSSDGYILADSNFNPIPETHYKVVMHFYPIVPINGEASHFSTKVGSQTATAQVDGINCAGTIDHQVNTEYLANKLLESAPQ
jgi:hypothetical protein